MKENLRKCQGCFEKKPKEDLIKITKLQNNTLKINPNQKEFGRSMYVCKNENCIKTIIKKKKIKTALKFSEIDEIEKIEEQLSRLSFYNS